MGIETDPVVQYIEADPVADDGAAPLTVDLGPGDEYEFDDDGAAEDYRVTDEMVEAAQAVTQAEDDLEDAKEGARRIIHCHHGEGLAHDCAYVDARNRLVPTAESRTQQIVGAYPEMASEAVRQQWARAWNYIFHTEMDRLWRERQS